MAASGHSTATRRLTVGEQPVDPVVGQEGSVGIDRAEHLLVFAPGFLLRVEDVSAVLSQLEICNGDKGHQLADRLNLKKVGMSGHSFGAVTTEAVSGESMPLAGKKYTDPRIKAAVIFSPSSPRGGNPARAFGDVRIPWLLMTGTNESEVVS